MKIAVLSDIHDNIWKLEEGLKSIENINDVQAMVFCGDLCAPFTLKQLGEGFKRGPIHVVWGNNDGDKILNQKIASSFDNVFLHGNFMEIKLDQVRIAANHYPELAGHLADSQNFEAVFYGHNHTAKSEKINKTDFLLRFFPTIKPVFLVTKLAIGWEYLLVQVKK